jgi:hypothetical protein
MTEEKSGLELKINTKDPIDLHDYAYGFIAISNLYSKFIKEKYPKANVDDCKLLVKEVHHGSVITEMIAYSSALLPALSDINTMISFVKHVENILISYFKSGARNSKLTNSDIKDFLSSAQQIASLENSAVEIAALKYKDKEKEVHCFFQFNNKEANIAIQNLKQEKLEREKTKDSEFHKVLMKFHQANTVKGKTRKKTGEKVIIEHISKKALPLIYVSVLAEEKIKHETLLSNGNPFSKGFIVDVSIETVNKVAKAYKIIHLHDVINL